jgi:hypothetical protein
MKVLEKYLVTVYTNDKVRLGAYELFGDNYNEVFDKAYERLDDNQSFKLTLQGFVEFTSDMLV